MFRWQKCECLNAIQMLSYFHKFKLSYILSIGVICVKCQISNPIRLHVSYFHKVKVSSIRFLVLWCLRWEGSNAIRYHVSYFHKLIVLRCLTCLMYMYCVQYKWCVWGMEDIERHGIWSSCLPSIIKERFYYKYIHAHTYIFIFIRHVTSAICLLQ